MARVKFYNKETGKWEYADSAFSGGNVEVIVPGSGQNPTGGGMSATASALLINILRNGVYSTDQSANITALEAILASGGSGDEEPDSVIEQNGSIITIVSGVTASQVGSVLSIA
jgi:hypothetical protein